MIGLLGNKVNYSYSPEIHNVVLYKNGIKDEYKVFNKERDQVKSFLEEIRSSKGVCNVTVPYKLEVLKHLDKVMGIAKLIGVNTIRCKDGLLEGINTDIIGFQAMIAYHKIDLEKKDIVILGNGATSRMVQIALTGIARKVTVVSLAPKGNEISYKDIDGGDICINTTPLGSGENVGRSPLTNQQISKFSTLIDLAYNPFYTKLLIEGRIQGKKVFNCLYMLVSQALHSQEFFHGIDYSEELVNKIYNRLKFKHTNLVLIGMPGVGKTTVANELVLSTTAKVIDIDLEIIEREQTTIEKLFEVSESHFRAIESDVTKEISVNENAVISTGGGIVLDETNMLALMEKGTVIFLNRPIEAIVGDLDISSRPLLSNHDKWYKLYDERVSLYKKYADYELDNSDLKQTVELLKKIWSE